MLSCGYIDFVYFARIAPTLASSIIDKMDSELVCDSFLSSCQVAHGNGVLEVNICQNKRKRSFGKWQIDINPSQGRSNCVIILGGHEPDPRIHTRPNQSYTTWHQLVTLSMSV